MPLNTFLADNDRYPAEHGLSGPRHIQQEQPPAGVRRRLGHPRPEGPADVIWRRMTAPRYAVGVVLASPAKASSIAIAKRRADPVGGADAIQTTARARGAAGQEGTALGQIEATGQGQRQVPFLQAEAHVVRLVFTPVGVLLRALPVLFAVELAVLAPNAYPRLLDMAAPAPAAATTAPAAIRATRFVLTLWGTAALEGDA